MRASGGVQSEAFPPAPAAAASADDGAVVAILLGIVLVPLLLFVVRRLMVRRIRQQMLAASAEQPGVPDDTATGPEVAAGSEPRMVYHEADRAPAGGSEPWQRRERAARQLLRQVCLADLGVALVYAVVPVTFGAFAANWVSILGLLVGAAIAVFAGVRYLLHWRQFRAFNLRRSRRRQRIYGWLSRAGRSVLVLVTAATGATVHNLVYLPDILRALFGPAMRTLLAAAAEFVAESRPARAGNPALHVA